MKLSIITPYYNALKYTKKLAGILEPQLNDEIEWIIVDDGCNEKELDNFKAKIIHLQENSGGASVPRNLGLDNAIGEYITFIDADDTVSGNYISKILEKIQNENFDYCYFSWKSDKYTIIITDDPPPWNCCVWNCIYKKDIIGNNRFDPKLKMAEDYDFNIKVKKGIRANILDILYFYNNEPTNSLTKQGELYNKKFTKKEVV